MLTTLNLVYDPQRTTRNVFVLIGPHLMKHEDFDSAYRLNLRVELIKRYPQHIGKTMLEGAYMGLEFKFFEIDSSRVADMMTSFGLQPMPTKPKAFSAGYYGVTNHKLFTKALGHAN